MTVRSKRTKKIRVLHVGKFYAPTEGGIENVVQGMVRGFEGDAEIAADVLVAHRKGPDAVEQMDGALIRRVRSHGVLLGTPMSPGFAAEIGRLAGGYDLLHVHTPNPLPYFCDWDAIKRKGVRLLVQYHSDIVRPSQRKVLKLVEGRERRFFEAAERIVCASDGLLRSSAMLQPYRDRCTVLPLSIALDKILPSDPENRAAARSRLGYRSTDVVFFFLGRLVWYKGVEDLIRAVALTKVKVMIGGGGPLGSQLVALAKSLGVSDRVQFLGRVPPHQLASCYAAADAFVLPSNAPAETFGVVQLEAMAHGLPVINTLLPTGVPEVSLDGLTGITVQPGDVRGLAEAMMRLANEAGLRHRYGTAARLRVQEFAHPAVMERLRGLYRDVADAPIRRASAVHAGLAQYLPWRHAPAAQL